MWGKTLMQALQGGGGKGLDGARKILARAGVAALLNSMAFPGDFYPTLKVKNIVYFGFTSYNRSNMITKAKDLDDNNNLGPPSWWP